MSYNRSILGFEISVDFFHFGLTYRIFLFHDLDASLLKAEQNLYLRLNSSSDRIKAKLLEIFIRDLEW